MKEGPFVSRGRNCKIHLWRNEGSHKTSPNNTTSESGRFSNCSNKKRATRTLTITKENSYPGRSGMGYRLTGESRNSQEKKENASD